jgi:hypothetical protein
MRRGFWFIFITLLAATPMISHAQDRVSVWSPRSPLSPEEMFAFTKSSAFTAALSTAVDFLNSYAEFRGDSFSFRKNNGANHSDSGLIGMTGYPFLGGSLIFSREIVTGNFLGTDNLIQLADQFGIRVSAGARISTENLPLAIRGGFGGSVSISRIYSHLKPITSMRKANRYPFQNAIVPLLIRRNAKTVDPLMADGYDQLRFDLKKQIYLDSLRDFSDRLQTGESIVITESLVGEANATANAGLYKMIDLSTTVRAPELMIRRLHLQRKSDHLFQLFEDDGSAFQPNLSVQVGYRLPIPHGGIRLFYQGQVPLDYATMPLLRAKWGRNQGDAHTRLYTIELNPDPATEQDLQIAISNLRKIRNLLLECNADEATRQLQPIVIDHEFKEKSLQDRILVFSQRKLRSAATLTLTDQNGAKRSFIRNFFGKSNGFDYTNPTSHALSFAKEYITRSSADFSDDTTLNPGYNSNGVARNRILIHEAEITQDGNILKPAVRLTRIFNGWNATAAKIQLLLDGYQQNYGDGTHPRIVFQESKNLFLYTIQAGFVLNDSAIQHLTRLNESSLRELFARHGVSLRFRRVDERIARELADFRKTHSAQSLMRAIAIADRHLDGAAFLDFMGGLQNLKVEIRIDGFKKVESNGELGLVHLQFPIAGNGNNSTPLQQLQQSLGMIDGEFHALWIKGRIL